MSRPRSIPDQTIFQATRGLMADGGDRAASFAAVSQATGLAGSSLAQRYGSQEGMVRAALMDGWEMLAARTDAAEAEAPLSAKGVPMLLKLIGRDYEAEIALLISQMRDPDLRDRAEAWRTHVETALALRLGGGGKRGERAAMVFSAWLGRIVWAGPGGPGFRLKSVARQFG